MEPTKVQIKGKAYPKAEFFFKHAHPHRWKFHQFIKRFFKLFGANVKFNYPD